MGILTNFDLMQKLILNLGNLVSLRVLFDIFSNLQGRFQKYYTRINDFLITVFLSIPKAVSGFSNFEWIWFPRSRSQMASPVEGREGGKQKWHIVALGGGVPKVTDRFLIKKFEIFSQHDFYEDYKFDSLKLKTHTHGQLSQMRATHIYMIFKLCTWFFSFTIGTWFYSLTFWETFIF